MAAALPAMPRFTSRLVAACAPGGVRRVQRRLLNRGCLEEYVPDRFARVRHFAAERDASGSLWNRFVKWSNTTLGNYVYGETNDINNCGVDLGLVLPRAELVVREGMKVGSRDWRMQMYGAALYWHAATTPGKRVKDADPDMLRGKDVLEVACMRGGGARYLVEVAGPRSYVATDNVEEYIDTCKYLHAESAPENLRFEVADALSLTKSYPADSFDVVLSVQAFATFSDLNAFVQGAREVLRPGGRLILCDAVQQQTAYILEDAVYAAGFIVDAWVDISDAVNAVGLCDIPWGKKYLRVCARLPHVGEEVQAHPLKTEAPPWTTKEGEQTPETQATVDEVFTGKR